MKIYKYDLIDENDEILSVKRIEKYKSTWSEYYRIVFPDEGWINLVGELSVCCERGDVRQIRYYSLYPLSERMIKTVIKAAVKG